MYQNINYDKKNNTVHIWDDQLGYKKFNFKPYGYLPDPAGAYESLDGTKLSKKAGNHKDNPNSYESDLSVEMRTLIDLYYETDEASTGHTVLTFDIETAKDELGYSTPENVRTEINAIACHDSLTNDRRVLLLDEECRVNETNLQGDGFTIEIFRSERDLLTRFINIWNEVNPTIVTGWNSDGYDIPYLINRSKQELGSQSVNKLSPVGIVKWNKHRNVYNIFGVSSLDYIKLYKNFTYTELANYRLDTVAKTELNRGKVEYDGDLDALFKEDIHKYAWYNMTDVDLVVDLDEKLQLINLARTISHKGHVPYEDVYYASKYLDGAAIVDLKRNGFVAPNKQFRFVENEKLGDSDDELKGAYVMPPVPGLYEWIYDLDLTSLYPSIIMSLNISPETKVCVINDWNQELMLKKGPIEVVTQDGEIISDVKQWLKQNKYKISSSGTVYSSEKKGFLPAILEKWFDERVKYKKERDSHDVGSEKYKFYDALQLTQKVLLNSFYGVLGLKTFRFHDLDNALAITSTGQSIIKFSAKVINQYYKKEISAANDDYEIELEDGSIKTFNGSDVVMTQSGRKPVYMLTNGDEIIDES